MSHGKAEPLAGDWLASDTDCRGATKAWGSKGFGQCCAALVRWWCISLQCNPLTFNLTSWWKRVADSKIHPSQRWGEISTSVETSTACLGLWGGSSSGLHTWLTCLTVSWLRVGEVMLCLCHLHPLKKPERDKKCKFCLFIQAVRILISRT